MNSDSNTLLECPCCGHKTWEKTAALPGDIKQFYISCLLSGTPYTRTYNLYNGKISIKCIQPSDKDGLLFRKLNAKLIVDNVNADLRDELTFRLGRLISVVEIAKHDTTDIVVHPRDVVLQSIDSLMKKDKIVDSDISELNAKLQQDDVKSNLHTHLIDKVIETHLRLCLQLQDIGFDQDFYMGITHLA